MKTFLKVLAGILLFIIVVLVGLNLYFTDDRLKQTVMPYVNDSVGREVQVESMSLTFFSTFPQPGLSIKNMSIPGDTPSDTLMSLNELVVGVELFSLFGSELGISEIQLNRPRFTYRVYEDGTSNIDFLLTSEEDTTEESGGYAVDIPYFYITGGQFGYEDLSSGTTVRMDDLNSTISLRYADVIRSTIDLELGGLTFQTDSARYVNGLPLSLSETSTIDLENETINLESGTLSIRGLALDLTGTIGSWSGESSTVNLQFSSSSDNFGELLRLAPAEFEDQIAGLETGGSLSISGSVSGTVGGESLPNFSASISVQDGYLKNPDLPQPIQDIRISAKASNELITVEAFEATAGNNFLTASGKLEQPLEDNGSFSLNLKGDVDLSTVESFYPLDEFGIEQLSGQFNVDATASGRMNNLEEAAFNGNFSLTDGLLKYADVPSPIDNINIRASGSQKQITISSLKLNAAKNHLTLQGTIGEPLDEENRTVDLTTDLLFDLATIKNFYPISEDTLKLGGQLTAQATLRGKADQIERAVQSGSINLKNGFIDYQKMGKPIENLTFIATLKGNRMEISNASLRSGQNDLELSGIVTDYVSENPVLDLRVKGNARFGEIQNYYDLRPAISEISGAGKLDLSVKGPIQYPAQMAFSGSMSVSDFNMAGDSLVQPVRNLNGELNMSPAAVQLASLNFKLGSSDISLSGKLEHYMEYLKMKEERNRTPNLTGQLNSSLFNMDELIDWSDTTDANEPIPIHLPDLNSSVTAQIDTLIVTGVTMHNLDASAGTTPTEIALNKASIELFGGTASGSFRWNVPQPERTSINFKGGLTGLNTNDFFREYQVLGPNSNFHDHVTGSFSATVDYHSVLDVYLDPVIPTTKMNGVFIMTKSRVKGHPLQERLATLFKADELRNIAIDRSETKFSIASSVMKIENLRLTSGNIGAEMNGTQHLINEKIDYQLTVFLPKRFRDGIASVITSQAADALTQENGTIMVPLRVTGTQNDPEIRPDQQVIQPILKDVLKNKAGDALKKLFGGDG